MFPLVCPKTETSMSSYQRHILVFAAENKQAQGGQTPLCALVLKLYFWLLGGFARYELHSSGYQPLWWDEEYFYLSASLFCSKSRCRSNATAAENALCCRSDTFPWEEPACSCQVIRTMSSKELPRKNENSRRFVSFLDFLRDCPTSYLLYLPHVSYGQKGEWFVKSKMNDVLGRLL